MQTKQVIIALALFATAFVSTPSEAQVTPDSTARLMPPPRSFNGRPDRGPRPPRPMDGRNFRRSDDNRQLFGRSDRQQDGPMNGPRPDGNRNQRGPGQDLRGPGRDRDRGGRGHGLMSLTTVTGTVGQLVGNEDFILDGFVLNSNPTMTVGFAPHLGQQVQQAIKPGTTVSVTGFADKNREGESRFRLISLTAGKTTVLDGPPVRPATPPTAPTMTTATGKITDYKLDKRGTVNGLVLSDNTIIRIPPHVAYQLTNLATKGTAITVQGYTRPLGDGQVQLQRTNILRASVITINGQQYLVR